jgi:hypothetical protein
MTRSIAAPPPSRQLSNVSDDVLDRNTICNLGGSEEQTEVRDATQVQWPVPPGATHAQATAEP